MGTNGINRMDSMITVEKGEQHGNQSKTVRSYFYVIKYVWERKNYGRE